MRLTLRTNRWTQAATLAAWVFSSGCQRLPYIDQSKSVPHDPIGATALEDKEVKQADFLSNSLTMQMPKVHKPRTTNDPEAEEIWPMTLQEAIRIGLDNSEIVRVIPFGAQGIPVGGFEPSPLNIGSGAGAAGQLGAGTLQSVYDPAILETQIATALSVFDTAFTTSLTWGK
ncbi:MAG: TolC family protein, partial [Isosphaeraceae bacterium]